MHVYSFYKFIKLNDLLRLRNTIYKNLDKYNIKGTILISHEGINVNISQECNLLDNALKNIKSGLQPNVVNI